MLYLRLWQQVAQTCAEMLVQVAIAHKYLFMSIHALAIV